MNPHWHLSHARGYLELGMLKHAEAELLALGPEEGGGRDAVLLWVALLHEKHDWRGLRRLAGRLVETHPEEPSWWVSYAFATRRVRSIAAAQAILLQAAKRHPRAAIVHFNLGCYACQLGEIEEAWQRVQRAIELDGTLRELARQDPDLEPLRATGATFADGAT